eukprot:730198-Amphidinium_carterae.1
MLNAVEAGVARAPAANTVSRLRLAVDAGMMMMMMMRENFLAKQGTGFIYTLLTDASPQKKMD